MLICYDGDTARVATSVLRVRKIQACSVSGGMLGYEFAPLLVSLTDASEVVEQQNATDRDAPLGVVQDTSALDRWEVLTATA